MSNQKQYYVYPPEVRGIKYNGSEVNRLYLNDREVYDANRMAFKITTNSEAQFGFSYFCDQEHYINIHAKGLGSEFEVSGKWRQTKRAAGWNNGRYWWKGVLKPNKDYVLTVKIIPSIGKPISRLILGNQNQYSKLKAIYSWGGGVEITGLNYAFQNASYDIEEVPDYLPKSCTSLRGLFSGCRSIPENIKKWNTSRIKDMGYTFYRANMNGIRIGQWDVGSLQDGTYTFYDSNLNENLGEWRPKNATTLKRMMYRTTKNTSCDLRNWCIPKVNRVEENDFAYGAPFCRRRRSSRWGGSSFYYYNHPNLPQFGVTSCR